MSSKKLNSVRIKFVPGNLFVLYVWIYEHSNKDNVIFMLYFFFTYIGTSFLDLDILSTNSSGLFTTIANNIDNDVVIRNNNRKNSVNNGGNSLKNVENSVNNGRNSPKILDIRNSTGNIKTLPVNFNYINDENKSNDEIKNNVSNEADKKDLKQKEEYRNKLKMQLRNELKIEIRNEVRIEIRNELREELKYEIENNFALSRSIDRSSKGELEV